MLKPLLKDTALLDDIRAYANGGRHFGVWWLGQSGFLLKWQGHSLIFDPYLSDSLTKKYADTDKPHERMTELCITPGQLNQTLVVTSSHNHTDHLDADTLVPLSRANPEMKLVIPEANIAFASERLAAAPPAFVGVHEGASVSVGPFTFTGIPAAHNTVERDDEGRCRFLGFVVVFGDWAIFHSGDTLWHDGLLPALQAFSLDLMFLPINGNRPERRVAGNLNGTEAAALARACSSGMVIPHHFEMFAFNTETPDEFVRACHRLDQPCRVLRCGERFSSAEIAKQ